MSPYTYQLVLQLPSAALNGFDDLVTLEDGLIDALNGQSHFVDGHDVGSGTVNFFVHTNSPERALVAAIEVFMPAERNVLRAAFRRLDDDNYTPIWPQGSREPFQLL